MKLPLILVPILFLTNLGFAQPVSLQCQNQKMSILVDEIQNKAVFEPSHKTLTLNQALKSPVTSYRSISGEYVYMWNVVYTFQNTSEKLTLKYVQARKSQITGYLTGDFGYPLSDALSCQEL